LNEKIRRLHPTAGRELPRRQAPTGFVASEKYRKVMHGIHQALLAIRQCQPEIARHFTKEESERARSFCTELTEWVDEFERNLPRAKK
jgi:hypothetical protein